MDRNIDVAGEKRSLNFRSEHSFATSLSLKRPDFIALCRNESRFDSCVRSRRLYCFFNKPSLRACQFAAARTQDDLCCHQGNIAPVAEADSFP